MDEDKPFMYHWKVFAEELYKLRQDDRLTDFTICVDDEIIKAHKVVLAANSDFFKAMLTNDSSEVDGSQATLKEVDPETIRILVDFWYTGEIKLTSENVCSILLAASRFQAKAALQVCIEYAGCNLTGANCLSLALVCERCNFTKLGEKALNCCLKNFKNITQSTELLCLDREFLTKIISNDRLDVEDEIYVFEAIIKWIKFDETSRSSFFKQLIREVRFASIGPVSLVEPRVAELVENSEEYREEYIKAMKILLLERNPQLYQDYVGEFNSKPRRPLSLSQRLYVLGGMGGVEAGTERRSCEIYDPSANKWYNLSRMIEYVGKNLAVAISGWDVICALSSTDDQSCQQYELDTDEWSYCHLDFHQPNCAFVVTLDHCIYSFVKPYDNHVSSIFKYDFEKNISTRCKSLREPRDSPGVVVHNHYIYVMGGTKTGSKHGMYSVDRYDTRKNTWKTVAPMKRPRWSFGSCSYKGKIYVAGGINCSRYIQEAEVYDPELDTWTEIKPMFQARAYFGFVELLDQIYAVGGRYEGDHGLKIINEVEAYDPDSNTWVKKPPMNSERAEACVLVTRKGNIMIPKRFAS